MGICETCGVEMKLGTSCTQRTIDLPLTVGVVGDDGVRHGDLEPATFERVAHEDEQGYPCGDCGVPVGGFHHIGPADGGASTCDQEVCPRCGSQLLMCRIIGCGDDSRRKLFAKGKRDREQG